LSFKEKIQQRILVQFEAPKPLQIFILKELALALNKFESIEKPQVSLFEDSEAMAEFKQKLQQHYSLFPIHTKKFKAKYPQVVIKEIDKWFKNFRLLLKELEK
jgi:hypothetical protein